jgi:hypothetical protein
MAVEHYYHSCLEQIEAKIPAALEEATQKLPSDHISPTARLPSPTAVDPTPPTESRLPDVQPTGLSEYPEQVRIIPVDGVEAAPPLPVEREEGELSESEDVVVEAPPCAYPSNSGPPPPTPALPAEEQTELPPLPLEEPRRVPLTLGRYIIQGR